MLLLCPKAPFRAVPEYVIDVSESVPIAFAAAVMTGFVFCPVIDAAMQIAATTVGANLLTNMHPSGSDSSGQRTFSIRLPTRSAA
jgi:hypothetical protein